MDVTTEKKERFITVELSRGVSTFDKLKLEDFADWGVILTGNAPTWLYVYASQYYNSYKFVAVYDKSEKAAIVAHSNSSSYSVGDKILPSLLAKAGNSYRFSRYCGFWEIEPDKAKEVSKPSDSPDYVKFWDTEDKEDELRF